MSSFQIPTDSYTGRRLTYALAEKLHQLGRVTLLGSLPSLYSLKKRVTSTEKISSTVNKSTNNNTSVLMAINQAIDDDWVKTGGYGSEDNNSDDSDDSDGDGDGERKWEHGESEEVSERDLRGGLQSGSGSGIGADYDVGHSKRVVQGVDLSSAAKAGFDGDSGKDGGGGFKGHSASDSTCHSPGPATHSAGHSAGQYTGHSAAHSAGQSSSDYAGTAGPAGKSKGQSAHSAGKNVIVKTTPKTEFSKQKYSFIEELGALDLPVDFHDEEIKRFIKNINRKLEVKNKFIPHKFSAFLDGDSKKSDIPDNGEEFRGKFVENRLGNDTNDFQLVGSGSSNGEKIVDVEQNMGSDITGSERNGSETIKKSMENVELEKNVESGKKLHSAVILESDDFVSEKNVESGKNLKSGTNLKSLRTVSEKNVSQNNECEVSKKKGISGLVSSVFGINSPDNVNSTQSDDESYGEVDANNLTRNSKSLPPVKKLKDRVGSNITPDDPTIITIDYENPKENTNELKHNAQIGDKSESWNKYVPQVLQGLFKESQVETSESSLPSNELNSVSTAVNDSNENFCKEPRITGFEVDHNDTHSLFHETLKTDFDKPADHLKISLTASNEHFGFANLELELVLSAAYSKSEEQVSLDESYFTASLDVDGLISNFTDNGTPQELTPLNIEKSVEVTNSTGLNDVPSGNQVLQHNSEDKEYESILGKKSDIFSSMQSSNANVDKEVDKTEDESVINDLSFLSTNTNDSILTNHTISHNNQKKLSSEEISTINPLNQFDQSAGRSDFTAIPYKHSLELDTPSNAKSSHSEILSKQNNLRIKTNTSSSKLILQKVSSQPIADNLRPSPIIGLLDPELVESSIDLAAGVKWSTLVPKESRKSIYVVEPEPLAEIDDISVLKDKRRMMHKLKKVTKKSTRKYVNRGSNYRHKVFSLVLKKYAPGETIRRCKMLVMVKSIHGTKNVYSFTENEPCDSNVTERWKEYEVVMKRSDDFTYPISIEIFAIGSISNKTKEKPEFSFHVNGEVHVRFYSHVDKTILIVVPSKDDECKVYILRTHNQITAFRWLYLLKRSLHYDSGNVLTIDVPKLSVKLQIIIPAKVVHRCIEHQELTTVHVELVGYRVEYSPLIEYLREFIELQLLKGDEKVLNDFTRVHTHPWFCFKNYDLLEWVHNNSEDFFVRSSLMEKPFTLQIRDIRHYPSEVCVEDKILKEPVPIEGFLARLSNVSGKETSCFRSFYKMLYFYTTKNMLFYTKYYQAVPPSPQNGLMDCTNTPELMPELPQIYESSTFPISENDHIDWLNTDEFAKYDHIAQSEYVRKVDQLVKAEGFIDMSRIRDVKLIMSKSLTKSQKFLHSVCWYSKDDMIEDKTLANAGFELMMNNGSSVKLLAPNEIIRDEWIMRLHEMRHYWKHRKEADIFTRIKLKTYNQSALRISEFDDANVAYRVEENEISKSKADTTLNNIDSIALLAPILNDGYLFQKSKKHGNFISIYAILVPGYLILFRVYKRSKVSGRRQKKAIYEHHMTIPIEYCYIYSGMSTQMDLIDKREDIDPMYPERHSLPRLYADGWKSSEEEHMLCFTLWIGKKRKLRRKRRADSLRPETAANPGLGKIVSNLGFTGKSVVFMSRSRQEQEIWTQRILSEIDRHSEFDEKE